MRTKASNISSMRNLGPYCERMLNAIGVHTEAELREMGPVNAYACWRCAATGPA